MSLATTGAPSSKEAKQAGGRPVGDGGAASADAGGAAAGDDASAAASLSENDEKRLHEAVRHFREAA